MTAHQPRPLLHAALLVGGLMILAVPFGYSVVAEYRAYATYVRETVRDRDTPPAWQTRLFTPADCVNATLDWMEGCPGMEDFCRGTVPHLMNECLASQDRDQWCVDNGGQIKKTSFGYQICEARREAKGDLERTRLRKQRCALALRALAEFCDERALDNSSPAREASADPSPSNASE